MKVLVRVMVGPALAAVAATGALSADLGYRLGQAPRRIVVVERSRCVTCQGSRLPFGGLRRADRASLPFDGLYRPYQAQLPFGGLGAYCPPVSRTSQVVLIRKG